MHVRSLLQLEEIGAISVQAEKNARQLKDMIIRNLKLDERNKDLFNPTNQSFVFDSRWNPLSVRLVHEASSGSWRRIAELLKHFNEPFEEKTQNLAGSVLDKNAGILVFIIGGITAAESKLYSVVAFIYLHGCLIGLCFYIQI